MPKKSIIEKKKKTGTKKITKKTLKRPPRLIEKNGKRYIVIGKKRILVKSDLPTAELTNIVVNYLSTSQKRSKKKGEPTAVRKPQPPFSVNITLFNESRWSL